MGLMDSLMGAAGQAAMDALQGHGAAQGAGNGGGVNPMSGAGGMDAMAMVGALLQQAGGLSGLLAKLQASGLGDAVQSWVGNGANQPVSADQLGAALGPDLLAGLGGGAGGAAGGMGLGGQSGDLTQLLAQFLPTVVDQLTPKGQLPADNGLGGLGQLDMGSLAGLAGQLLKGR